MICNPNNNNSLPFSLPIKSQTSLTQLGTSLFLISIAALAVAALCIGVVAIGALAIGKLSLKNGRIEKLSIGELEVDALLVRERYEEIDEEDG